MPSELTFRISLAVIGALIYVIRFYYMGLTGNPAKSMLISRPSKTEILGIGAVGLIAMVVPITYVFMPYWLDWAAYPSQTVGGG